MTTQEHMNRMAGMTLDELQAVLQSKSATVAEMIAARVWVDAASTDRNAAGSPIAGAEFDRIMDRTQGKPTQAVDVTSGGEGISFAFVVAQPDAANDPD